MEKVTNLHANDSITLSHERQLQIVSVKTSLVSSTCII